MVWDPTQPATNAPLLSAPIRDNFAALDALMTGGGGMTFPLLAPDGLPSAPSYGFASDAGTGLTRNPSSGLLNLTAYGGAYVAVGADNLVLFSSMNFGWASGDVNSSSYDLVLKRDAAGILSLRGASSAGALLSWKGVTAASVATPAATTGVLYMDSADKKLYFKNDAGLVSALF